MRVLGGAGTESLEQPSEASLPGKPAMLLTISVEKSKARYKPSRIPSECAPAERPIADSSTTACSLQLMDPQKCIFLLVGIGRALLVFLFTCGIANNGEAV